MNIRKLLMLKFCNTGPRSGAIYGYLLQGILTEGKGSVQLTSLYLLAYISHFFLSKNIIYIINKTHYLNEEVDSTEPSPSVRGHCLPPRLSLSLYIRLA